MIGRILRVLVLHIHRAHPIIMEHINNRIYRQHNIGINITDIKGVEFLVVATGDLDLKQLPPQPKPQNFKFIFLCSSDTIFLTKPKGVPKNQLFFYYLVSQNVSTYTYGMENSAGAADAPGECKSKY